MDYASQGNAILGIRDSGKSYSATYLAEQLLENNIPFIAFDPIGVWRYLQKGKKGEGFPVVVAGDNGDLPLTPESAADIVRAAMAENVSLVLDLYSMQLSKADWKKIVESCVRLLLYENKPYGLRHVFIEEAAEFCPQRVGPDQGRVYAEIEKLARMGGNASLGYTLINQRPEEVNKAVLELCDCLFLHRQKGRHSITALGKWLDITDTSNAKQITNSLPSLEQGECWIWSQGSHTPKRVKMPEKKTIHPDRRNPEKASSGVNADVSMFVENMKKSLAFLEVPTIKQISQPKHPAMQSNNGALVTQLESKIHSLESQLSEEKTRRLSAENRLELVKKMLSPQYDQLKKIFDEVGDGLANEVDFSKYEIWLNKFSGKHRKLLELIIEYKKIDRPKLALLSGIPYNSRYFDQAMTKFKQLKLVSKEGNDFVLQQI